MTSKPINNFLLLLFYCLITGAIALSLGQDLNWDLRNYHIYLPYQFLNNRFDFDVMPAQIQTFYTPFIDIPFYLAAYTFNISPKIIAFTLGAIQGINLFLIHLIANKILPKNFTNQIFAFIAALTALGGCIFFSEIGTVFGDSTSSVFVMLSLLILVNCKTEGNNNLKYITLAGLLLGLGSGLKYTNIIHVISISIAFIILLKEKRIKIITVLCSSITPGVLLTAGYWLFFLWHKYGNPLLPFYNHIFQSPYLDTGYLKDWRFYPTTLWQYIFYPFYFFKTQHLPWEMPFRDLRLAIGMSASFLLILACLFFRYFKVKFFDSINPGSRFLAIYFLVTFPVWMLIYCYYRYILPLELISPLLLIALVASFNVRNSIKLIPVIILLSATIYWAKIPNWGRGKFTEDLFAIDSVKLKKYENSLIVIWDTDPLSFIIPSFPESSRFVRINSNRLLTKETILYKKALKHIAEYPEDRRFILTLSTTPNPSSDLFKHLEELNLEINYQDCQSLSNKVKELFLCPLITSTT